MMYYARSDTHYLLYIYDRVRNDLVASSDRSNPETDLIRRALEKSKEVSLYRHEHPECNNVTGEGSRGWYNYILKNGHLSLDSDQFAVFRAMWKWRDATARKEDENPNFVLSTNTIVQIARVNPPDIKALHSMLPLSSPLARQRLNELWEQVQATKAEGGPSLLHYITSHAPEPLRRNGSSSRGVNKTPTVLPKVDDGDEAGSVQRLAQSQLFGSMPISTRWEESKKSLQRPDDHVPFPWQRFVQDANAQEDEEAEAPEPEQAPAATDEQANGAGVSEEEADEEFTLKRGKKRKAAEPAPEDDDDDTSSEGESDADEADHDTSGILALDEEKPRRPRVNKKARKEEKRQQKQLQMEQQEEKEVQKQQRREAKAQRKLEKNKKKNKNSGGAGGAGADKGAEEQKYAAVPFDYSKAASVLDADRSTQASEDKRKKDKARVFDPYVKSVEDGVKGARKAPPIRGERSATFKK